MWKATKNDSEDLAFALACLFSQAISLNEFKIWIVKVIEQLSYEETPLYLFKLLDFNESLFNIYNVVGFTPDEELKLIEQYALYGIAYLRDINVYNAPCSRASAIYALSNYTEIKEKFTKFFDIKL